MINSAAKLEATQLIKVEDTNSVMLVKFIASSRFLIESTWCAYERN